MDSLSIGGRTHLVAVRPAAPESAMPFISRGECMISRRFMSAAVVVALAVLSFAQAKPSETKGSPALTRGKYLVEDVGMCQDCHSPRDQQGQFVRNKWMQGTPTPFKPLAQIPGFAEYAPSIAGLPAWSEADVIRFMMNGLGPAGARARPPMPQYRFQRDDAAAVAKYLKSLQEMPPSSEAKSK